MSNFFESTLLLFVLLNPFLLSVYLAPLIRELDGGTFRRVIVRASIISAVVFFLFAWAGDAIFTDVLQARYASFQIFGGLIFLAVGFRFMLDGAGTIRLLRGDASHLSGSVALPFMIGPATVSASVVAGGRLSLQMVILAIGLALAATTAALILMKALHDRVQAENATLVGRYWEITGRVMAMVIGTLAVEMILQGIDGWLGRR